MSEIKKPLLIADLIDLDLINYKNLDGFVVPIKGLASYDERCFDLNEVRIINDWCKNNNILIIVKIDKIIMEEELNNLFNTLDYLESLETNYYMYTDASILSYFSKLNKLNKLIYASSKMVASFNEASYYVNKGINVVPSSEVSLEEIKKICSLDNICITSYGLLDIFYSKRKLISLYKEHIGKAPLSKNKKFSIIEESRDDKNIILENENGTFIFSSFTYLLYRELAFINPKFIKINSFNIKKNDLFKIIDIYKAALASGPTTSGYDKLLDINGNVDSGFLYKKAGILNEK